MASNRRSTEANKSSAAKRLRFDDGLIKKLDEMADTLNVVRTNAGISQV